MLLLTCHRCNNNEPPHLSRSGPHVKASCYTCMKYIRFVPPHDIGPLRDIKLAIWTLADKNETVIADTKGAMDVFDPPPEKPLDERIVYHNLYCELLSMCEPEQKEAELSRLES